VDSHFIHLRMYQILIERLQKHPKISDFRDEFQYNQKKSKAMNEEIKELKNKVLFDDPLKNSGIYIPEQKSTEEKFAFLNPKKEVEEDLISPRSKRIQNEKEAPLVKRKNQNFINVAPGENILENQFYNLEDCALQIEM
jgi:hypothetical protein